MKSFLEYLLEDEQLTKDEITLVQQNNIKEAFEMLKKMILSVQDDYAKCLAALNLFDDHSVGTLSEKILAYFINSKFKGHAKVLAGNANLTDIQIKTSHGWFNLSIKTTDSKDTINLGTMEKVSEKTKSSNTVQQLKKTLNYNNQIGTYDKVIVKEVNNSDVNNRINAIVEKLCGTNSNPEVFCWIKKTNTNIKNSNNKKISVLKSLKFDLRKFNKHTLRKWFDEQYIHLTENAYGIKTTDDIQVVGADLKGKYLNIKPEFLNAIQNVDGIIEASSIGDNNEIVLTDIIEPIQKIQNKYIDSNGNIIIDDAFIKAIQSLYK